MPPLPASGQVRAAADGSTVTILLSGELDGIAGQALIDTLRDELSRRPVRVDIDLRGLIAFTDGGASALAECRPLSAGLSGGLHYRTEGGAGQGALLAAFSDGCC
jgi:hypothetical protein